MARRQTVPHPRPGSRALMVSPQLWPLEGAVGTLLDVQPMRPRALGRARIDMLVGLGTDRPPVGTEGPPFVALEGGFLRSIRPSGRDPVVGWVMDHTGIHYDPCRPSDLESLVHQEIAEGDPDRARAAIAAIRERRLSKYNYAPMATAAELELPAHEDIVLLIDQTDDDIAVCGVGPRNFEDMLTAALDENPGRFLVVTCHPNVVTGSRRGFLADRLRDAPVHIIDRPVNPWALLERASRLYTVSSRFGFEAMLAGVPVTCFGAPFFAGWGLTDDRAPVPVERRGPATLEALAGAALIRYSRYIDPYSGAVIPFEEGVERLTFLRDRFQENGASICLGIPAWNRPTVSRFLEGPAGVPEFMATADQDHAVSTAARAGGSVVVWAAREPPELAQKCAAAKVPLKRMEDGFLRSVGLGLARVRPMSLVVDPVGIHFDGSRPSWFEELAEHFPDDPALVARGKALRDLVVARGLSKYNDAPADVLDLPADRLKVLVPGQVEDDASIRLGSPVVKTNLALIRAARLRFPDAFLIYKPHPDVLFGDRAGAVAAEDIVDLVDLVVTDVSMAALFAQVDRLETMTSLAGFEALLRGLPVGVHGQPFYAGWGLTDDALTFPRRTRRLTIDELAAVALILYPRYVDPVTDQPCPPEIVIQRLSDATAVARTALKRVDMELRQIHALARRRLHRVVSLFRR